MSKARLKTLVIALLVLLNLFFLAIIITDNAKDAQSRRQAVENVCELLRLGGISIEPEVIREFSPLTEMKTTRDTDAEALFASVTLGETEITDQGVIYIYENSERGRAEFYSAGDFVMRINEGVVTSTNDRDKIKTVRNLLRDMKLEASQIVSAYEADREIVSVRCSYGKASIFNCSVEFVFNGDNLEVIKGRYITGILNTESGETLSSPGTALLGLLRAVKRGEVSCESVKSVEAGYYYLIAGSFGEGSIIPAWLITTDIGSFIYNERTGEIAPA